ncbi:MAG: TetR/AcrR family transcriptional regulator [Candidatus Cloacimonadales bacterium]
MNKRELHKQQTRNLLLQTARECFVRDGFLQTPVSKISAQAQVAHGTLFAHFQSKDNLILQVIDLEMSEISAAIEELLIEAEEVGEILQQYLNLLAQKEAFFTVLAKETPFYSLDLRRKLIFRDSVIRSYFFQKISEQNNSLSAAEISSALNWLFGTLNYYLANQEIFVQSGSVIEKFRGTIIHTFKKLIGEV